MDLSVCLVATELFAWGRLGGIGQCTRSIGAALARRGVKVSVVLPFGEGQAPVEEVDGMTVHGFPLHRYPFTAEIYRMCDSDIYHSEGVSWGSRIAADAMPGKRHVVTCQNPRSAKDWRRVYRYYPWRRQAFNAVFGEKLKRTVKEMDAVYCQAQFIIPKVKELYGLRTLPGFLPNPVKVPEGLPRKSSEPTVCFLGRLDGEKRPELFFELAGKFPDVRFIAMGRSHDDSKDRELRDRYSQVSNLEMPGFMGEEEKEEVLDEAWVLVNTSVSECLPVSFLEAAAHGCAILSFHDPDGFANRFGYYAADGELDTGLVHLFAEERWKEKGRLGHEYVGEIHEERVVLEKHLKAYDSLLEGVR